MESPAESKPCKVNAPGTSEGRDVDSFATSLSPLGLGVFSTSEGCLSDGDDGDMNSVSLPALSGPGGALPNLESAHLHYQAWTSTLLLNSKSTTTGITVEGNAGTAFAPDMPQLDPLNFLGKPESRGDDPSGSKRTHSTVATNSTGADVGEGDAEEGIGNGSANANKRTKTTRYHLNGRGPQMCNKCGKPRKGHVCPLATINLIEEERKEAFFAGYNCGFQDGAKPDITN